MFFKVFKHALVSAGIVALSACGGGEPVDSTSGSIPPAPNSALQQSPSQLPLPSSSSTPVSASASAGAVRPAPAVGAAEREAEQLRMVPYEQAFSIEMQRRAQERPEHLRGQGEPVPAQAACEPARPSGCPASPPDAAPLVVTPAQPL
ncbi:hypothetical protein [Massilia genomosp. 1]|uniref:Uncharacterized protein n=1 Tax=Massilia genomosp. 1 TaxID=2609280 RepID=A0ABX0MG73_9BURK|nr:hypothetical protein [Massilia genomosp. 1]NHZ61763.1 hypothetical protein [Massilia genomosp. 1]